MRCWLLTLLILEVSPLMAQAQTLTIQIEGEIEEETEVLPTPVPEGVVLVRPLEEPAAAPIAAPIHVPSAEPEPPSELEGASQMGVSFDTFLLMDGVLELGAPEVAALRGLELGAGWQREAAIGDPMLVGLDLGVGMRAAGFFRGPSVHVGVSGSELDGDWTAARPGFDLVLRRVTVLRVEVKAGLQAELGPVTPYVVGRAVAGLALLDLDVRHAELGALGGETVEFAFGQVGLEAGVEVDVEEGIALGMAYRGGWVGLESHGGIFTFGFHG